MMVRIKQFVSRQDPGFLLVLALCLLALWPFLSYASLPEGTDAELHIFRLHELSLLMQGGEWYPRWAPNFYHGYGYPIFNYYAPLTYYVGLFFERLPGLDAVAATKAVFISAILLAGCGMYGFVRDNWGRAAGLVAAALYVYAPYLQYIDPHARGVMPESFSFGVFALALWGVDRLRRRQTAVSWSIATFTTAAVILSHNLMGLLFFGILCAWDVWQWGVAFWSGDIELKQAMRWVSAALLLGLGLAAIFWLPVILERNEVNLNTLLGTGDNYDFRTHFLSLREMLAFSLRFDWGATEPMFRFNLGVVQWVLGLLGLAMLALRKTAVSAALLFFTLTLLVLIALMLPLSTPVWSTLFFLPFFQFPWRLLGAAAAMLAIVGGAGVAALMALLRRESGAVRKPVAAKIADWLPAVVIGAVLLLALPLSQPAPWPPFGEVNTLRMSLIEKSGRWLGTTSTADYVPVTVDTIPRRNEDVVANLFVGQPLDRVNRLAMPDDAEVVGTEVTPLHFQYHVVTPKQFRLRLFLFDFPGWEATVDGDPAETELGRPEGFLIVKVPAGEHLVDVQFKNTPARNTAVFITLGSLLVTIIAAVVLRRRQGVLLPNEPLTRVEWRLLGVTVGVTAVAVLLLHPAGWLHMNSTGQVVEAADVSLVADFGEQIALLGYDTDKTTAGPNEFLAVTLYWKAQQELDINYQSF
ncbi:MAG: hypothetical protein KC419_07700, partial [Anaerolineales bacterium]|nr:hypothetical protein [Anaerolineales bacterium]